VPGCTSAATLLGDGGGASAGLGRHSLPAVKSIFHADTVESLEESGGALHIDAFVRVVFGVLIGVRIGHQDVGRMGFPIPNPVRLSNLPVFKVSCLLEDGTKDSIAHATPLQLASAIAAHCKVATGPEQEAFLSSLCFAAEHGRVTGRVALNGDVEVLVAQLLSSYRRTRGGEIPFGAAFRVRRFLEDIREP